QEPRPAVTRDRAALVGLEREKAAGLAFDRVSAGLDPDRAVDHRDERAFLDLVVTERLSRIEHDQYRAGSWVRAQHDGRAAATRCRDLTQVPALHGAILSEYPS